MSIVPGVRDLINSLDNATDVMQPTDSFNIDHVCLVINQLTTLTRVLLCILIWDNYHVRAEPASPKQKALGAILIDVNK